MINCHGSVKKNFARRCTLIIYDLYDWGSSGFWLLSSKNLYLFFFSFFLFLLKIYFLVSLFFMGGGLSLD